NPAGSAVEEDAFGPRFFRTHFFDRMREACAVDKMTPIIEVVLTSGQVLDISTIIELKQDYMLVSAFVDTRDCANTYQAYVRYQTIYRINVLMRPDDERAIGFNPHEPEDYVAPKPKKAKPKSKTSK
ncbi:MAG: hypothetical protein KDB68_13765, partial [Planctomycetes bacterium]|nr:hypothetical protein [Planctomycetota bacterium]